MSTLRIEAEPESVGMSASRLARIDHHFRHYVDDGRLAGWQLAVARHGKVVHHSLYGHRDLAAGLPVEADTIWRIYSMTKPITAVLALQLWEEGAFELNDPLHRYLPAFRDTKVWRAGSVNNPILDPQVEPVRLWQLFAHTAGLTYGFMYNHPVDELYRRAGFEWGVPKDTDLAGVCDVLAGLPLVFQPGTEWNYSMGLDVLGRGAVHPDRHDAGRRVRRRDGLLDRRTPTQPRVVPAAHRDPRRERRELREEPGERRHLLELGDRLAGEQVGAARREHLEARPVEAREGRHAQPVPPPVLRAVGEHRAVRPDRGRHEPVRLPSLEPTRLGRQLDAPAQRGRRIGAEIRIAGVTRKNHHAPFFQVAQRLALNERLGHLVHLDRRPVA